MQPSNVSILIVDDSSTMRAIIRDMLMKLGFRIFEEADDGQSALAKVKQRSFTLIISDWNMEPMTGIDFLREVNRIRTPGTNRFIFATSERTWGKQTTAKLDGAAAFITKPFTLETLKAQIETVLGR